MSDPVLDHANTVLAATREELTRADNKAALLLATAGVAIGALLAALLAGSWSPSSLRNAIEWLWWLGAFSVGVGVFALGWAIFPRLRVPGPRSDIVAFFGDVVVTPADELPALLEATAAAPLRSVLDQLRLVSIIVRRKYLAVQMALICFSAGAVGCVVAVLLNSALT